MSGEMDEWHNIVQALVYHIQFEPLVDETVARRVAAALIEDPLWQLAPAREYEILSTGLRLRYPLPPRPSSNMKDGDVLDFLSMVLSGMDALRPWPVPPFSVLPEERLAGFVALTPIATVNSTVADIEDRIGRLFDIDEDFGDFLLIRLRSGIEVGLLGSTESGTEPIDIVSTTHNLPGTAILDELAEVSGLDRALFIEPN